MEKVNLKEHLPIAKEEVHVLLFELKETVNTGDSGTTNLARS